MFSGGEKERLQRARESIAATQFWRGGGRLWLSARTEERSFRRWIPQRIWARQTGASFLTDTNTHTLMSLGPKDQLIKLCVNSQVWHCTCNVAIMFHSFTNFHNVAATEHILCCLFVSIAVLFVWIVQVTWFIGSDNTVQSHQHKHKHICLMLRFFTSS